MTAGEAKSITTLAKPITDMYFTPETPSEKAQEEDTDKYTMTQLERQLIKFNAGQNDRFNRADRRGLVNPVAKRFFELATKVASRGEYIRPATRTQAVLRRMLAEEGEEVAPQTRDDVIVSIEDPETLTLLALIDVFTFCANVPDEIYARQTRYGNDVRYTRNLDLAGLVASLGDKPEYKGLIEYMFKGQPKHIFSRKLKGDNERLYQEAFRTHREMLGIDLFSREHFDAMKNILDGAVESIDTALDGVDPTRQRIEALLQELTSEVGAYIDEEPTPARVLGGLAIENWIEALTFEQDEELARLPREKGDKPLHDIIEDEIFRIKLRELEAAIGPSLETIQAMNEKYTISSPQIRSLNGLDLRRIVEAWSEPGSQRTLFTRSQAQLIVGLSLQMQRDPGLRTSYGKDFAELQEAWANLTFFQNGAALRSGLICDLDTLVEWYQSAPDKLLDRDELKPLWALAKLHQNPRPENAAPSAPTSI